MRGRNQKITSFFLLAIILAPLSYMFILQSRQQQIRHRMKEELEQSLVQELVIPTSELQWFKPGKEIVVDNQLFDIKNIRYSEDGNAYITGLFDKEETILVYQMKKDGDEQNRNSSRQVCMVSSVRMPVSTSAQPSISSIAHRLMWSSLKGSGIRIQCTPGATSIV